MRIRFIPAWLARMLEANDLPLSTAYDVEKLSSILSKEDLFFYFEAQCNSDLLKRFLLKGVADDFCYGEIMPIRNEMDCAEFSYYANQLNDGRDKAIQLIYGDMGQPVAKYLMYRIEPIAHDEYAIVFYPVDGENTDTYTNCLGRVLDVIGLRIGHNALCQTQGFTDYVKRIQ